MVVLVCWCDRCDRCYTLKLLLFRQIASMLYTAMDLKICFLFFGFRSTMISGSRRFDGCNPFWVCPLRRTPYRLGQIGIVGNSPGTVSSTGSSVSPTDWVKSELLETSTNSSTVRPKLDTKPYRLGQIGIVGNACLRQVSGFVNTTPTDWVKSELLETLKEDSSCWLESLTLPIGSNRNCWKPRKSMGACYDLL